MKVRPYQKATRDSGDSLNTKNKTQGVAPIKNNGKQCKEKSTILNDQFKSVFSEPSPQSLEQLTKQAMNDASPKVPQVDPFKITEKGVRKLLSGLNPNKAAGPNKLSHRFLKNLVMSWPQW